MRIRSPCSAFCRSPFKLHGCTCHFTSCVNRNRSLLFVRWKQLSPGKDARWHPRQRPAAEVSPASPANPASPDTLHSPRYPRCPRYPRQPPAAPIRLSRRQLGNRWQTKGSPLKLVPTWFLLIDSGSSTGGKRVVLDINYLWVHSLRLRSAFSQGPRR